MHTRGSSSPCFGLALGGGGVRGLAHLGVLRALERVALLPDVIAGTSSGAVIAAAFASGSSADDLIEIALRLRWSDLVRPNVRRDCLFDTSRLEEFLGMIISAETFERFRITCAVVARDALTGESVVLRDGNPLHAVAASAAVRRAFPAVEIGGRRLVDGHGADPIPVTAARELGADYVVGVALGDGDLIRRMRRSASSRCSQRDGPEVMIRPALPARATWDFSRARQIIAAGESAAISALSDIHSACASFAGCAVANREAR